jgi:exonuclease SbcC
MNRQFIKKSDDIGFILIDDPVQTMDDINIASLIEVLRNDFSDKQIVLSTHETDKENYILYKFLKYNQKGQSFNVKERLYQ